MLWATFGFVQNILQMCIFLLFDGFLSVYWLQHLNPCFAINNAINFHFSSLVRLSGFCFVCVILLCRVLGGCHCHCEKNNISKRCHHMFCSNNCADRFSAYHPNSYHPNTYHPNSYQISIARFTNKISKMFIYNWFWIHWNQRCATISEFVTNT